MKWYELVFVLIDMRSFSNLWYWIAVAVLWSSTSHWVMGVPFDMITRAKRLGGQHDQDLQAIVRINASRLLHISRTGGIWIIMFASFVLTTLAILAFLQGVEFAQAVILLLGPMTLVGFLSLRLAYRIEQASPATDALVAMLMRHRLMIQFIGMVSVFVTSMFGMYHNLMVGNFG